MEFAVELPGDDHAAALEVLARVSGWHKPPGRLYETAEAANDAIDCVAMEEAFKAIGRACKLTREDKEEEKKS